MEKFNYISYSLWGDKPIYNVGILKNIEQARHLFRGWKVVVYYDNTVPPITLQRIEEAGGMIVDMTGISYGMFWRFFAADLPDCNVAIFRDSDSRLSTREKLAVDEWITSGKAIHIIRDHPHHETPYGSDRLSILGGMWGIRGNLIPMRQMIENFSQEKDLGYGVDQTFLKEIQTMFVGNAKVHDEFFSNSPFPVKRKNYRFIGERIDENDKPVGNDWEEIRNYYAARSIKTKVKSAISRIYKKIFRSWFAGITNRLKLF